ncbi:ArnT family glycosyltransferase [Novosphingobium taihuense]|uniref:Glycosyltransferase RgtA/B/C/D-like domain-containing protein n=1 Tax=Novosphingobium taihuense TaxID=260085 RepID=A0A7W7AB47_9SPHN|nr:glycosyltransferase family 39 protein [Novosphingobium taihuense]MBB4613753.1 hypothetical protein [Novosphingobium taihuense]TWH83262.1 dolichyl-phosphate-mannose-protein mannosyltransferase [Novosphingobium taihuense]
MTSFASVGIVSRPFQQPRDRSQFIALSALLVVLALQFPLVLSRAINWDEFWHYSLTVMAAQGLLDQPLQTFFTRAFMWVPDLPGNAVDHVVLIRMFMLGCELVTLACITAIATRFSDRTTGLLSALTYVAAGYVLQHGTSFRFDPQATALLMTSLWVLVCRPADPRWLVLAGVLGGFAGLITIKAVLYAPAFAGVFWLRWNESGRDRAYLKSVATMVAAAGLTFAIAYSIHAHSVVEASGRGAKDIVGASAEKMFSLTSHPYWRHNLKGAIFAPATTLLALAVPFALLRRDRPAAERIALAGLWFPLTTLGFYHNTAPYYHVFMLAPVAASASAIIPLVTRRYGTLFLAVCLVAGAAMTFAREQSGTLNKQRQLVAAANQIFGAPVGYFDSCAMLGQFPKANGFMTPWGTERYLRGELPSLEQIQHERVVPLVVNDDKMFADALETDGKVADFLSADLVMLRQTYRHFWGPYWIAGFDVTNSNQPATITVRVPGPYTVGAGGNVTVDGTPYNGGQILELARGKHTVLATGGSTTLTWGRALRKPVQPAPAEPYFTSF